MILSLQDTSQSFRVFGLDRPIWQPKLKTGENNGDNSESRIKKSTLPYVVSILCPILSCFVYLIVLFFF